MSGGDNPDRDIDPLETDLVGEVSGDEADIAPIIHEQRGLVSSYLNFLKMQEHRLRLSGVMTLVLAGADSLQSHMVEYPELSVQ